MKVATCNAAYITLVTLQVLLYPRYCLGAECKSFPCAHALQWARRHGLKAKDLKGQSHL